MNYKQLFDSMYPGFFDEPGIKSMPEDEICAELIMDLRMSAPKPLPYPFPDNITFGIYHGEIEKLKETVGQVDKDWIRYFHGRNRTFCAFDRDKIVSFCILEDWGRQYDLHIGGPGCVGTIPEYRGKGIGLETVRRATNVLKEENFDISWIHYTHLWPWYENLGYQTVLRWNCREIFFEEAA